MREGIQQFEGTKRPSRADLENKAEEIWGKLHLKLEDVKPENRLRGDERMLARGTDTGVDMAVRDLRGTAEEPDREKNPDSLAYLYPGYEKEDLEDLAKILEAKK